MDGVIRKIERKDKEKVIDMMRTFYATPWVLTNGSEEIFNANLEECLKDSCDLEGYVYQTESGIKGYAMVAKSFSTEFGKRCIWIEDLYVEQELRGQGVGSKLIKFIEEKFPNALLRLEVEDENERAIKVYKKNGFEVLPYKEMKK